MICVEMDGLKGFLLGGGPSQTLKSILISLFEKDGGLKLVERRIPDDAKTPEDVGKFLTDIGVTVTQVYVVDTGEQE